MAEVQKEKEPTRGWLFIFWVWLFLPFGGIYFVKERCYSVVKELGDRGLDQCQSTKPAAFHEARAVFLLQDALLPGSGSRGALENYAELYTGTEVVLL